MNHIDENTSGRRNFISSVVSVAGTTMIIGWPGISIAKKAGQALTVGQVIDTILKEIPNAPFERTVDQLIAGNKDQVVTGVVTTMFPTMKVIEQTAEAGANMIIAHETPFYNHQDQTDWLQEDVAYLYKKELLNRHGIAIWRFHDYWHAHRPDGIIMGNLIKLGWDRHYDAGSPRLLQLPEALPLTSIAMLVKEKLGISTVRVTGRLDQPCRRIYLAFGYMDSKMQIAAIRQYQPDLILSGETREWETVERVRDGQLMGKNTALMVLSHSVSEEAGMEYAAKWLQPKVPGVKVMHIAAGNPFVFL